MARKILLLSTILILFLLPIKALAADSEIQIIIDGEKIISDTAPIISSDRVLVPVRVVSEKLGFYVQWNPTTREVSLSKDDLKIRFNIDKKVYWKNDQQIPLDVAPLIKNDRVYLPIRVISESTGAKVNWDGVTKSVIITTPQLPPPDPVELQSIIQEQDNLKLQFSDTTIPEPKITRLSNPDRLVIDLNNTIPYSELMVTNLIETELIQDIRFSHYNNNPNQTRIVVDLKSKVDYQYTIVNNEVDFSLSPYKYKVVLDPGHGGKDPGAISVTRKYEKDLNLTIGLMVAELLKNDPNLQVVMTRDTDEYISLDDRVAMANKIEADLFVSIHANALPSKPEIKGMETYYARSESLEFTKLLHRNLVGSTGFTDRGVKYSDFRVIKYTTMPAALIELGYLTNASDEKAMFEPTFQQNASEAIARSIQEYLALKNPDYIPQ